MRTRTSLSPLLPLPFHIRTNAYTQTHTQPHTHTRSVTATHARTWNGAGAVLHVVLHHVGAAQAAAEHVGWQQRLQKHGVTPPESGYIHDYSRSEVRER